MWQATTLRFTTLSAKISRSALSDLTALPDVDRERSHFSMPNSLSFRYFKTSPAIIQLAVMLHVRSPLSLRSVEDLLHERGVDVSYESIRYWWHRFGARFASQIKKSAGQGACTPVIGNGT